MATSSKDYDFSAIEAAWQKFWKDNRTFRAADSSSRPKYYVLGMFPYPSGDGLHIGHSENYTPTDIIARYKRARGFNVIQPMGWDSFGLPTEQYAIKTGRHPEEISAENIGKFRRQLDRHGFALNWDREVTTSSPEYYRWTQWIFLLLFKRGLAYVDERPVWWCPELRTVLANEEVIDGRSERGNFPVERRNLRQWVLRITAYADRLLEDLPGLDWPESTKKQQEVWIGRSEGAEIDFPLEIEGEKLRVFTTRPDTLFGATYMVIAPEHPLLKRLTIDSQRAKVEKYVEQASHKSDLDRTDLAKDKTGVFTGSYAINPMNGKRIPIWVADYVLMSYGTGAIMAVPAHDERDHEFATRFDLPIVEVISQRSTGVSPVSKPEHFLNGREPIKIHERGLPHWQQDGAYYFVTCRLADSLPSDVLDEWRSEVEAWKLAHPEPLTPEDEQEFHQLFYSRIEDELDRGSGSCLLRDEKAARIVADALKHFDGKRYELTAFAVMPNHVHVLFRAFEGEDLSKILHSWKSFTAKEINRALGRQGAVWQEEYFDRIVRGSQHFENLVRYILRNPEKGNVPAGEFLIYTAAERPVSDLRTGETPVPPSSVPPSSVFTGAGIMVNSGPYDGMPSPEAKKLIVEDLEKKNAGKGSVHYKLRDWLFSRQRFWGEPFPVVWLSESDYPKVSDDLKPPQPVSYEADGAKWMAVSLPDTALPLTLPDVQTFQPAGAGESPLAKVPEWLNVWFNARTGETVSASQGQPPGDEWVSGRRETNTMPQWAGSCWYYLRYLDPKNGERLVDPKLVDYWDMPDLYIGGAEHAVLHLLYARFWHKVLFDAGLVRHKEPFPKLFHQGMILGEDGEKMSKSRGNVVNPDALIESHGADALRLYLMFLGPLEAMKPWNTKGIEGVYRFLRKAWREYIDRDGRMNPKISGEEETNPETSRLLAETIKKAGDDIEALRFNTAVSQMMIFVNHLQKVDTFSRSTAKKFLQILAPFAPHIAEELWERIGEKPSIVDAPWPKVDATQLEKEQVKIIFQVNGKYRGDAMVSKDASETDIVKLAEAHERVAPFLRDTQVRKVIYVPGRILNLVVG